MTFEDYEKHNNSGFYLSRNNSLHPTDKAMDVIQINVLAGLNVLLVSNNRGDN